jgi:hypothetical protein
MSVSCFPSVDCHMHDSEAAVDYQTLSRQAARTEEVLLNIHPLIGDKVGCLEEHCSIKRRWVRKIAFY